MAWHAVDVSRPVPPLRGDPGPKHNGCHCFRRQLILTWVQATPKTGMTLNSKTRQYTDTNTHQVFVRGCQLAGLNRNRNRDSSSLNHFLRG